MERLFPRSWNDNASLQVVYVLPMTRLRLIVIFIVMFVILYSQKESSHKASKYGTLDTAREPMKIDLLVKNVIKYPCETQRRKPFKCHIESNHDGPRYPCKDCEAPLNAEARLKCEYVNTLWCLEHSCYNIQMLYMTT